MIQQPTTQNKLAHTQDINTHSSWNDAQATGIKYDEGKPEASLLPKGVMSPILQVLGFGAKKYARDNWQKVPEARKRYYDAAQRHITSWWEGEKLDPETGVNHLAHASCCLLFLLWFDNNDKEST